MNRDYVAGLFDGEGCFVITKANTGASKSRLRDFYYTAEAAIEIREEFIVDSLVVLYGGHKTMKTPKNEKHSVTYRWKVTGSNLKFFCSDIQGSLLIKNEQAQVVLDFLKVREGMTTTAITESQIAEQESLREKIMSLNKKGVGFQHRQLIPNNVAPHRKGK